MKYCMNISLSKVNIENIDDLWALSDLFDDETLISFISDNQYAKYIYFIKEYDEIIGFVYVMPFKNSNINNIEYGIKKQKLNNDYIYTVLTILRDKVKGYNNSTELKDSTIITSLSKDEKYYNELANKFGRKICETFSNNYYEINPNCEDINNDSQKLKIYMKDKLE